MSFTVTLNGTPLQNEPRNLLDASVQILRDKDIKGLFVQFIADLEFWGDGYNVLNTALSTTGFCDPITCDIVENCEGGLSLTGLIFPSSVIWNETDCIITATVEDNTAQARILRLKDVSVQINGGETVNGDALADIGTSMSLYSGTFEMFQAYYLMQYILNYITDGEVLLDSDILQTDKFTAETYTVLFGGTIAVSDSVDVSFVDIYGNQQTITVTSGNTTVFGVGGFNRRVALEINHIITNLEFNLYNMTRPLYSDYVASENPIDITFLNEASFAIDSTNAPNLTVNVVKTQSYQYGLADLYFASQATMSTGVGITSCSFASLFTFLDALANLSMSFYNIGSQQYVKIEIEPEFFDNTPLFTLSSIRGFTRKPYNQWTIGTLNYQAASGDGGAFAPLFQTSYIGAECLDNSITTAWGQFRPLTTTQPTGSPDDVSSIFVGSSPDDATIPTFEATFFEGGFPSIQATGAVFYKYPYQYFHQHIARQWAFRSDGLRNQGLVIQQIQPLTLKYVVSFDYPLTIAQFNALSENPEYMITANPKVDAATERDCYLLSAEYSIKTGMTTFELLTE